VKNSMQVKRMNDRANELLQTLSLEIIAKYSIYEIITWGIQTEEAREILSGGNDDIVILSTLAAGKNSTSEEFANAVMTKRAEFKTLCANALAQKRAFLAGLKAEVGL
ncbi:MAG: hypothetical protein PHX65_07175, partial [Sulfurimonas sp.]|nr:hypothetical protein [Sulfurimonas sp.]